MIQSLNPNKCYKKEFDIDGWVLFGAMLAVGIVIKALTGDLIHGYLQIPSLLLFVVLAIMLVLPSAKNEKKRVFESVLIAMSYGWSRLKEKGLHDVFS